MVLLVHVAPDLHGGIPELEQKRLREVGVWLDKTGDAIYGTRGGPRQPADRQYGYCCKASTVYVHLLKDYAGDTFKMPLLGSLRVKRAYDVYAGKSLAIDGDRDITIHGIDRSESPADSIIAVDYSGEIQSVWKK